MYTLYLCGHRKAAIEDCPEGLAAKGAYPCGGPYFWNKRVQRTCKECVNRDAAAKVQEDAGLGLYQRRLLHGKCCDSKDSEPSSKSCSSTNSGASFRERVQSLRDAGEELPV
jgi:hypothetical protein